jgi:hypothetical protein
VHVCLCPETCNAIDRCFWPCISLLLANKQHKDLSPTLP